jgi:hypothetical protein
MLMLSTVFTGEEFEYRVRRRPTTTQPRARPIQRIFGGEAVKTLSVPSFAANYNDFMGAVNVGDQLKASSKQDHRVHKGTWHALAWSFLFETALVNSYLLQQKATNFIPFKSQNEWQQHLVEALFAAYSNDGSSRQKYRSGDINTPVSQHNSVRRGKKATCLACKGVTAGQIRSQSSQKGVLAPISHNRRRRQTVYGCDKCDVALCTSGNCWDFYHSGLP